MNVIMNLKRLFSKSKFIYNLYCDYLYFKYKRLYIKNPRLAADRSYYSVFKRHINWENPTELNEKIRWMLLNTDTSLWTQCADKYRVREYVKKQGCEDLLVELYGCWNNPEEINFDTLPQSFVLKANNGCGTVKIVKDKSLLNRKDVIKELKKWIARPYGYMSAQTHYLSIKPCIIAEKLLTEKGVNEALSPHSLIDYKVWCINGKVECILVVFGRHDKHYLRQVYNSSWEKISGIMIDETSHSKFINVDIPRPECLERLVSDAEKLASPFPEVRVDFYIVDNKLYFGELTFTAGMESFTEEYFKYLGEKIDISKLEVIKSNE